MKKLLLVLIGVASLFIITGCGKEEETTNQNSGEEADVSVLVGSWDNNESQYSAVFKEDGTVEVYGDSNYVLYEYEVNGSEINFDGPSEDTNGTLEEDEVLIIEGISGVFIKVDRASYIPGVEENFEGVDVSFWHGEYENDNGTLTIESSILDSSVDFAFSMEDGNYYSGTFKAASNDGTVLEDSYIRATYDSSDSSITVEVIDDADTDSFSSMLGTYYLS